MTDKLPPNIFSVYVVNVTHANTIIPPPLIRNVSNPITPEYPSKQSKKKKKQKPEHQEMQKQDTIRKASTHLVPI